MGQAQTLDFHDLIIFYELLHDPLQSANKISSQVGLAPTTVRDRIFSMKKRGFLGGDKTFIDPVLGERTTSEVSVSYDPQSLGLIRHHVVFSKIKTPHELNQLIKVCNLHPYTHYRAGTFGDGMNLYTQFDVPPQIEADMLEFYRKISRMLDVNYHFLTSHSKTSSIPDFSQFSLLNGWKIPPLDQLWADFLAMDTPKPISTPSPKPKKLTNFDASLLRELTINAKVSVKFLSNQYNRPSPSISRHLKYIRESFIERGLLIYDPSVFDLDSILLISGKFKKDAGFSSSSLRGFVSSGILPFTSTLYQNNDEFLWITTSSSTYSAQICNFVWRNTVPDSLKISQLDRSSRFSYFFYNLNYDEVDGWNIDREYVLDQPLSQLETKGQ